jgi:hypothetical protein
LCPTPLSANLPLYRCLASIYDRGSKWYHPEKECSIQCYYNMILRHSVPQRPLWFAITHARFTLTLQRDLKVSCMWPRFALVRAAHPDLAGAPQSSSPSYPYLIHADIYECRYCRFQFTFDSERSLKCVHTSGPISGQTRHPLCYVVRGSRFLILATALQHINAIPNNSNNNAGSIEPAVSFTRDIIPLNRRLSDTRTGRMCYANA